MKNITISTLGALLLGVTAAQAQTTAFTDPSGYVTVPIAKPAAEGQSKLTAFSVTLRQPVLEAGNTTSVQAGSVTKTSAGWTNNQWNAEPHLLCLTNSNGGRRMLPDYWKYY